MSKFGRAIILGSVWLLAAAAEPPKVADGLHAALIEDARALDPAALPFERTTTTTKFSPISRQTSVTVDRWDGQRWELVSINGKPPATGQLRSFRAAMAAQPVPGYHRLAAILAAATSLSPDDQGRHIARIPVLPAGSVRTDSADISAHLTGEAVIAITAGRPWVTQLKLKARENFKLTSLIKVTDFQQTFDYRLGPDGRPRLATQTAASKGQMFGFGGGETSQVSYSYR